MPNEIISGIMERKIEISREIESVALPEKSIALRKLSNFGLP